MTNDKLNLLHELLIELANDVNTKYGDKNDCAGQVLQIESGMSGFNHPGVDKIFADFRHSYEIELGLFFESMFDFPADAENVMPDCKNFSEICMTGICRLMNNLYDQPKYFVEAGKVVKK